jgi:hypothetical protein
MTAPDALGPDWIRARRAGAQRVGSHRQTASAPQLLSHVVGVQAQDVAAATLGIAVRTDNLTVAAVERARNVDRSIVRIWCLRGTLHLIAAEDVHWMLDVVRPQLARANKRRRLDLGLDDSSTERGVRILEGSLRSNGPQSRAELAEALRRHDIESKGQATIHVIWRAAIDGRLCFGPDRDGEETFVALQDWVPSQSRNSPGDGALKLARRYLAAYGPATREDFATWAGLSGAEVRRAWTGLAHEARPVGTPYGEMLVSAEHSDTADMTRLVRLLPAFDGIWLGYRDHDVFIPREEHRRVFPGGGMIRPFMLADGHIVGTWMRRTSRGGVDVSVELFEPVGKADLSASLADFGRITERPVRLVTRRAKEAP